MSANAMDGLLGGEVCGLLDRLGRLGEVSIERLGAAEPPLRARLEAAEIRLTVARLRLLDEYAEWRRVLAELEELWGAAARRSAVPEDAAEEAAAIAA